MTTTVQPTNRSLSQVRQALAQAREVPEMKRIRNTAEAAALLAFREGYVELYLQAKLLVLEAERTIGRWLRSNVNHNGGNPNWSDYQGLPEGITKRESSHYQLEASLPEEKFRSWVDSCLAGESEMSSGILRRIACNYQDGHDETNAATFDVMKGRALYWVRCILLEYPDRFGELVNAIIQERKK